MVKKRLFEYQLPNRKGLIVQCGENFGEIAPLPYFSKETFDEAKEEALLWLKTDRAPKLASVCFGIFCASKPLRSVHLPLCALGFKEGFETVKLKLKHFSLKEAIAYVKPYIGKVNLRLDCNRAWNLDEALFFASHFLQSDFEYLEEPLKSEEELIEFSKRTHFPIALDESIHVDWNQIPSLRAIVVKPTILGSIPKVPTRLKLILSSSYESGLGLVHIANLCRYPYPIGLDTVFEQDLIHPPIQCQNGIFHWDATDNPIDTSKLCAL